MSTVHKVMLTGEQFRRMVKGEICKIWVGPVAERDVVEVAISDIGFEVMRHYIDEAERETKTSTGGDTAVSGRDREG